VQQKGEKHFVVSDKNVNFVGRTKNFRKISEDFGRLQKISEDFRK